MNAKKVVKTGLAVAVTAIALWLSFRKVDWDVLKESFRTVNWVWVMAALAVVVATVYALGWRWRILLRPKVKVSMGELFRLNILSQYWNIILPARAGEVVRAYLVSRNPGLPVGYAMGTVVIEKVLDFLVFVGFWLAVPAFFAVDGAFEGYWVALLICGAAVLFFTLLVLKPGLFLELLRKISRFLPEKYREGTERFFETGAESFQVLRDSRTLAVIVGWSVVFVGAQALANYFLFLAFAMGLSFWAALVVLLAVQVGNIPPSVPGKVGIFEYAVILALSVFGVSKGIALGYAVMLHVVAYLPKIIIGFWFFAVHKKIKWQEKHA
jgi:uncharacterized protein (TIRG00374 family)